MAEEQSSSPRRSLAQAVGASLPQFLSPSHLSSNSTHPSSRRSTDFGIFSSRTPDFIRKAMGLAPKRRMSEMPTMISTSTKHRDSLALSSSSSPIEITSKEEDDLDSWQPTHRQRDLLKQTWSDDFDFLFDLGTHIYCYIFDHEPRTRNLFPALKLHGDNWRESREFRAQALKFVQTLSQTIKNVHHMDRLRPLLYNVGRVHVRFAERGFRPEYWNVFEEAMESSLAGHIAALDCLTDEDRQEAIKVWRILARYIIHQMRKGYLDGLNGGDC
uniref:Globin family profile domain-containing protein n=1 Tax=Plectus sambesii TaxID=2011161 RepID=A0A914W5B3_9BILA